MRSLVALSLFAAAAGCIDIPDTPSPQCYSNSDCDQSTGEVCAEGVCYGDPPSATFGVSISPPASRADLTSVERKDEDLPASGLLTDLILETPVTLSGSVTAAACVASVPSGSCPTGTLSAAITISRPPRFAGGDGFTQTAQSTADATAASFTLAVPRTRPGVDPLYTVTVVPADLDSSSGSAAAPAQLVPPLRTTIAAGSDTQMPIALGGDDLVVLTGDLADSDGTALTDYRVSAVGRWLGDTSNSEVSSIAYTPDGHFAIALSAGLDPAVPVTIVAKPLGAGVAPTLELAGVDPTQSATFALAQPGAIGAATVTTVTITGTSTSGAVGPVSGARVIALASASSTSAPQLAAVVSADVTTGSDGTAQLPLLDGAAFASAGYELRVVPPAGSSLAVLDEASFQVGDATLLLVPRVALQGTVVDATGVPVANVSVTAQPSLRFAWSLDATAQVFLAQIPAATAVTGDDGDFLVFVDPTIESVAGYYDLAFEPPTGSSVPSYTDAELAIPAGTLGPMMIALGKVALPAAANLHGQISDPSGAAVSGGELRVFRLAADNALCGEVPHAPAGCAVPAQLQAHATSDDSGEVRFTLPR